MSTIGIECSISSKQFSNLLLPMLLQQNMQSYIPWSMLMKGKWLPDTQSSGTITLEQIVKYKPCIWELAVYFSPDAIDVQTADVLSYDAYFDSNITCCVLYYDCRYMEIYSKDTELLESIVNELKKIAADDVQLITSESRQREYMVL